jgi:high-affinity iron transporter
LHAAFPTLAKLSESSESALTKAVDADVARGLTAYLRSAPGTLAQSNADTLPIAMTKLKASVAALETGDMAAAARLGLSAYLDGFEPVEPALAAKNNALFRRSKNDG